MGNVSLTGDNRYDNILDRFPNPEMIKEALLARTKSNDPYPEGFREVVMDTFYNRFNGDRAQTARYTGVPAMTIRSWTLQDQKDEGREKPVDQFLPEQARYVVPKLKQAMIEAIESLPGKIKKMGVAETLRMLPHVAKLIKQLEAGEVPHDFTTEDGKIKHPPNRSKPYGDTAAVLTPELEPEADLDADEILQRAEAKMKASPAN